jgi:hypothetical protein
MRPTTCLLLTFLLAGCQSDPAGRARAGDEVFAPTAMRIHPIFTGITDWTTDGLPDGIDALIEFQDQFGDPTKVSGRVIFELFEYHPHAPDPRGERLLNPWIGTIETLEQQRAHWNRTSRTYGFQLAWPQIQPDQRYVLTAVFERTGGGRFFSRTIVEPPVPPPPATVAEPAHRRDTP